MVDEPLLRYLDYRAERLHPEKDEAAIAALIRRCADYVLLVEGELPKAEAAAEFFDAKPDGKTAKDMFKLGVRNGVGELMGLMDSARDHPESGTWYLGLLLLDPTIRHGGLGRSLVEQLVTYLAGQGSTRLMLAVVEENQQALHFWRTAGFETIRELPPRRFGTKDHCLYEMARPVA
jgi:ribosomal protein S18 acetylase RimI-like enzyme